MAIVFAALGRLDLAPIAVLAGAVFDFFDGFIARKLKVDGEMGKQLDSLADIVTFGVAPGVIMMVVMTLWLPGFREQPYFEVIRYDFLEHFDLLFAGEINDFMPLFALAIPFFSLFRLAKFNTDERQKIGFLGLPTPANAMFFMTFPLIIAYPQSLPGFLSDYEYVLFTEEVLAGLVVLVSLLCVIEIPLISLKFTSFGWKGNESRFILLLISIVLIVIFKGLSLALIVFLYLIISLTENIISKGKTHEIQS
jgi:CDP-diacylglycerol--serine O-phosphatidyltransferase